MKILVVGASGMIGSKVFKHCLAHPSISRVIACVRRELPGDVANHRKLETVIIKDFAAWPDNVLIEHSDAVAMVWCMGTNHGSITADLEHPLTFIESMNRIIATQPDRSSFRYVHLSGKFVRQDQEQKLWLLETPRKMKGLLEKKALAFAESHATTWKTFIVKPGGVMNEKWVARGVVGALFGENWCVRVEELAAFMTNLAVNGEGEDPVTENARIVVRGRELLGAL